MRVGHRRAHVVVVNIHGGVPPSLLEDAVRDLRAFRHIAEHGEVHSRVYSEHVHEAGVLDGLYCGGMSHVFDRVHYPWSGQARPSRALFHAFKREGYSTHVRGAFGLEATFNPHQHRAQLPPECMRAALGAYGVDDFASSDSAFGADGTAWEHDSGVLDDVECLISGTSPVFAWANLKACADAHRFAQDPRDCAVPCWHASATEGAVDESAPASEPLPALAASAAFDAARGGSAPREPRAARARSLCWECLCRWDERLLRLLGRRDIALVLVCDTGFGLFEHGCLGGELLPWDSCLRGFVAIAPPRPGWARVWSDAPEVFSSLFATVAEVGRLAPAEGRRAPSLGSRELQVAASLHVPLSAPRLARYVAQAETDFCGFFVRGCIDSDADGSFRLFTLIIWFSLRHLRRDHRGAIPNPVLGFPIAELQRQGCVVQAYDLENDPSETQDLSQWPAWSSSKLCYDLKARFDDAMVRLGMDHFAGLGAHEFAAAPPTPDAGHAANAARTRDLRDASTQVLSLAAIARERFGERARCVDLPADASLRATVLVVMREETNAEPPVAFAGHWLPDALAQTSQLVDLVGSLHRVSAESARAVFVGTLKVFMRTYVATPLGHAMYLASDQRVASTGS